MKHFLAKLYQECLNHGPCVKIGPDPGVMSPLPSPLPYFVFKVFIVLIHWFDNEPLPHPGKKMKVERKKSLFIFLNWSDRDLHPHPPTLGRRHLNSYHSGKLFF